MGSLQLSVYCKREEEKTFSQLTRRAFNPILSKFQLVVFWRAMDKTLVPQIVDNLLLVVIFCQLRALAVISIVTVSQIENSL
jgi:hypothetical protein